MGKNIGEFVEAWGLEETRSGNESQVQQNQYGDNAVGKVRTRHK